MIEARGLTRTFTVKDQTVEAVRGIDLDVAEGELVAVLGPNGAGKSTTLRMLTTLLQPTSGTARVVGCDVVADPAGVRRRIGYIGQGDGAGHTQRARDELVLQGRAYGMARRDAAARADELLDALGLGELGGRTVSTLSGGQRRRLDVALGMVHRPALLFLDEPSTGLDPQNRANLADEVRRLRTDHGTTVVLTTHYLDEADALADRVVVVDHGRVIADDTPARLKADLAGDHVVITVGTGTDAGPAGTDTGSAGADVAARDVGEVAARDVGEVVGALERTGAVQQHRVDGSRVTARVRDGATLVPAVLRDLDRAGVTVAATEVARPTLDDVFLALTGRSLRDGGEAALSAGGPGAAPGTGSAAHAPEAVAA